MRAKASVTCSRSTWRAISSPILRLGEGAIYHPGGIDYDGHDIWVPVAEYRPDSRSIVYRVDPATMTATEVFRVDDHIGAIVHNTDDQTLHGVSWGSRRFYRWTLRGAGKGRTLNHARTISTIRTASMPAGGACCAPASPRFRQTPDAAPFRLGGIDLVDLVDGRPLHQIAVRCGRPAVWT